MPDITSCSSVAETSRECFTDGRNCAESVLISVREYSWAEQLPDSIGSGFTSGIGHSGCICGALAGGVMSVSAYAGTKGLDPVAQREFAEELAAEYHDRFKERWGSTCCRVIKRNYTEGSAESTAHCTEISEYAAALVAELTGDARSSAAELPATAAREPRRARSPRDVMNAATRIALDGLAGVAVGSLTAIIAPMVAPQAIALAGLLGLVAAAACELGSAAARRVGRALRVAGVAAISLIAVVGTVSPGQVVYLVLQLTDGTNIWMLLARVVIAVCAMTVSALSLYRWSRHR